MWVCKNIISAPSSSQADLPPPSRHRDSNYTIAFSLVLELPPSRDARHRQTRIGWRVKLHREERVHRAGVSDRAAICIAGIDCIMCCCRRRDEETASWSKVKGRSPTP